MNARKCRQQNFSKERKCLKQIKPQITQNSGVLKIHLGNNIKEDISKPKIILKRKVEDNKSINQLEQEEGP